MSATPPSDLAPPPLTEADIVAIVVKDLSRNGPIALALGTYVLPRWRLSVSLRGNPHSEPIHVPEWNS